MLYTHCMQVARARQVSKDAQNLYRPGSKFSKFVEENGYKIVKNKNAEEVPDKKTGGTKLLAPEGEYVFSIEKDYAIDKVDVVSTSGRNTLAGIAFLAMRVPWVNGFEPGYSMYLHPDHRVSLHKFTNDRPNNTTVNGLLLHESIPPWNEPVTYRLPAASWAIALLLSLPVPPICLAKPLPTNVCKVAWPVAVISSKSGVTTMAS